MIIGKGIPPQVVTRAKRKLKQYANGIAHTQKFMAHDGESLQVGTRYRLLRKNRDSEWMLISHERYNRLKDSF